MQEEINAASSSDEQHHALIVEDIENAPTAQQVSPSILIHRVPKKLRETSYYHKYYVPKVVSIGPYHHGKQMLEIAEKHKPDFTKELLSRHNKKLKDVCQKFEQAISVRELSKLYEEISPLSDKEFTKMMLLDGCFILYYIQFIYFEEHRSVGELVNHHIVLIYEDLFLYENQIPFEVLNQLMDLIGFRRDMIESFIEATVLARGIPKRGRGTNDPIIANKISAAEKEKKAIIAIIRERAQAIRAAYLIGEYQEDHNDENHHLLHRLYCNTTRTSNAKTKGRFRYYRRSSINTQTEDTAETNNRRTFHSVNQLIQMGIHIKPSSSRYLEDVEFVRRCWCFSADLKLPPMTVARLLNFLANEMCLGDGDDAWVVSYLCLLDSLIQQPDDVRALRNAGIILDSPLGNENDSSIAEMFNAITTDLVPINLAYSEVKKEIQNHYATWTSTRLTDLKHDYLKSPWSLLAILGGVMVLFLSGVQTYFTVWSPKSECDHLCKFLKMNHHL